MIVVVLIEKEVSDTDRLSLFRGWTGLLWSFHPRKKWWGGAPWWCSDYGLKSFVVGWTFGQTIEGQDRNGEMSVVWNEGRVYALIWRGSEGVGKRVDFGDAGHSSTQLPLLEPSPPPPFSNQPQPKTTTSTKHKNNNNI
jgi:hypothetical protein